MRWNREHFKINRGVKKNATQGDYGQKKESPEGGVETKNTSCNGLLGTVSQLCQREKHQVAPERNGRTFKRESQRSHHVKNVLEKRSKKQENDVLSRKNAVTEGGGTKQGGARQSRTTAKFAVCRLAGGVTPKHDSSRGDLDT